MVFFPVLWVILIPYLVFYFTDTAAERGGRRIQWVRHVMWAPALDTHCMLLFSL
jgi:hypothetical protein